MPFFSGSTPYNFFPATDFTSVTAIIFYCLEAQDYGFIFALITVVLVIVGSKGNELLPYSYAATHRRMSWR